MPLACAPLASSPVALLLGGLALSAIGNQLYLVVLGWMAVEIFVTRAGLVVALQAGVMLITALLAGRMSDAMSNGMPPISSACRCC